ncbi:MAG TPA: hypothetical protein VF263_01375 [Longimicrobiaceae bacterium]
MRRRLSLGRSLAAAVLACLPVVACTDEPPTAAGEDLFPNGALPLTFEVTVPADSFVQNLGAFSGYTGPADVRYLSVANRFEGALDAHLLARFTDFPATVTFTQGGTTRTDSVFTYGIGTVVARLDTLQSTSSGSIQLQLWELDQSFDPASATWTLAVDTTGERTAWREPGGTRGTLLATVTLPGARSPGDSVAFSLDSLEVQRIARAASPGLLVTATGAQGYVQLSPVSLRTRVHPRSASPDTAVAVNVGNASLQTFVFNPEQPTGAAGVFQAGGIRSARTLFRATLPATLPVCRQGTCTRVPLRDLTVNEASLLFRPAPVAGGFRPVGAVPLLVRRVAEPGLGRRAPLGEVANEIVGIDPASRTVIYGGTRYAFGDTLYTVPITTFAARMAAGDTSTFSLALLSDPGTILGDPQAITFGTAWFAPNPRLRIVYTLPERPSLR